MTATTADLTDPALAEAINHTRVTVARLHAARFFVQAERLLPIIDSNPVARPAE